jgi:hypothetical protein
MIIVAGIGNNASEKSGKFAKNHATPRQFLPDSVRSRSCEISRPAPITARG